MDLQTGLVCVAVVVVSAVVIFVISMFGIKEKTYEEAIAEQRKLPEENLLLGRNAKDKAKDKKQKKAGKKVKEKPTEKEKTKPSEAVSTGPVQPPTQDKAHVDFVEPEAEVVSERPPKEEKKKKKKEKVKPILLNKTEQSVVVQAPPAPANRFEEIQPKDDLLLKRKGSRDELANKTEPVVAHVAAESRSAPEKPSTKHHHSNKNDKKAEKPEKIEKLEKTEKAEKATATAVQQEPPAPQPQQPPPPPPKERSKKKKSELATLQQMTGEREGVNVSLLVPLVRKAELSRSENQILIDLLLNKQQGSAVGNSEWIEGRQDPVVKLKKQLAEKEKALQEEQEASQSFQNKLKELRSEFNAQRSQLNQNNRQLEETLVAKQNELKALTVRLQHITDTHGAEKQALTQQNQQAEAALKTQIGQLHGQLQEQENINSSLSADLQKLRESQMTRDGENKILRDQISHLENQIRHLQESSDHAQELTRQIEELHRIKTELELQLANASQREAALQYESGKLREEVEALKEKCANYSELKNEASHLRSENEQLLVQTADVKDLEVEAQQLQEENERLLSQLSSYSQLELEAQQLREENESLAAQVTAMTERPAAEGRENGDLLYTEEKQVSEEDTLHQESMVKQKELPIEKISDELKEKDSLLEKLNSEINTYKTDISKLNEELELQRRKNNDLRSKNWKVMEALSATEKSLELKVKESNKLVSDVSVSARTEQQKATKQLLQRIFPDVRIEENKDYDLWLESFESAARSYLNQQRMPSAISAVNEDHSAMLIEVEKQNTQLQAMVTHYKTIIEETEGMLNKLQNHVEQEEARWRQQLQMKETELESIREERDLLEQSLEQYQRTEEMQTKLKELQGKLQLEESEKRELVRKYEEIQRSCDHLKDQLNSNQNQHLNKEQIEEENERLNLQLKTEQERNHDLAKEVVKLKSLVQIGQDSLNEEQKVVQQLQQQLDKLNGVNQNHNVATNGPASEPSITESLSASPQPLSDTSMSEKRPKSKKKKAQMQKQKNRTANLSPELAAVVGTNRMPRHDVEKKIRAIIEERNLFDPANEQFFICDDELMRVFGIKHIHSCGYMKYLELHILD